MKKIIIIGSVGITLLIAIIYYMFFSSMDKYEKIIPEVEQTQFASEHAEDDFSWRNLRYGEIIPVWRKGGQIYMEVYNTVYLNELPDNKWYELDTDELKEEYGALEVKKNGPRYWVIDRMEEEGVSKNGKVVSFNDIEMARVATLDANIFSMSMGEVYKENEVARETIFTYEAGEKVYDLIDGDGNIYRMQSYSQIVVEDLTIDDLDMIDETHLKLPSGWSYEVTVLDETFYLNSNGFAKVINDDLGNSYQKIN